MANFETRRDENTFFEDKDSGLQTDDPTCDDLIRDTNTYTSSSMSEMSGDSRPYKSILSRLTARRGAKGIRTVGQKGCLVQIWIPGQLSEFVVSGTGSGM